MSKKFNYIVPIYNKEDILPSTLEGIERTSSPKSKIVLVVDGCTDRSEAIVNEFIRNSSHEAEKIIMPNVHMLLSVNAGLKKVQSGFSIIMQDDIILKDLDTEKKLIELYNRMNSALGVISFRYGSNIGVSSYLNMFKNRTFQGLIEETDLIKGPSDYADYPMGDYGNFYPRMSSINGPNCIPWELLSKIGFLDENLAPYGFDDPEYCIRSLKSGFMNGLFPIHYQSELEWGGTRRSKKFIHEVSNIHKRNRIYIYKKHGNYLKEYLKSRKIYRELETL